MTKQRIEKEKYSVCEPSKLYTVSVYMDKHIYVYLKTLYICTYARVCAYNKSSHLSTM